ncbi:MAG: hypothetical protein ACXVJ8_17730, partial [Candidatus Angelobacter sp.]
RTAASRSSPHKPCERSKDIHLACGLQVHDGGCVQDQFLRVPLRSEFATQQDKHERNGLRRRRGCDVYMLDWNAPRPEEKNLPAQMPSNGYGPTPELLKKAKNLEKYEKGDPREMARRRYLTDCAELNGDCLSQVTRLMKSGFSPHRGIEPALASSFRIV